MKQFVKKLWLIGFLLFSSLLWAEVPVSPAEQKALQGIEANIAEDSYFKKLRRVDDPERRKVFSYGVDSYGHVISLNLSVLEYENLHFLEAFPKLRFLSISDSKKLTSMRGIESSTQLEKISFMQVPVTRIEGLDKLEQLVELSIFKCELTSMAGIGTLESLRYLSVYGNQIARFEELEDLTQLEGLDVSYNPIESMSGLGNKPKLKKLSMYETEIYTLEEYESLSDMQISVNGDFSFEANEEAVKQLKSRGVEINRI